MQVAGLVPARFMTIIGHLVLLITLFWSMDLNIKAGLSANHTQDQYTTKETQMYIALGFSVGFIVFELVGFFAGISTFFPSQGLISTLCHSTACIVTSYFLFELWPTDQFWYIFGFCSCLPFLSEVAMFMGVFCFNKTI